MYKVNHSITFSSSDLMVFMNSPFSSWMARLSVDYPDRLEGIEKDHDEMMGLLATKGGEHETSFLEELKLQYGADHVAVINPDFSTAQQATKEAMEKGYQVIFQAFLKRDEFAGFADFLVRREGRSDLGNYYYEAWDTKLSKTTKPYFVMQLCCYSWMLEEIQGKLPEEAVVVLGDKTQDRLRLPAYSSYFNNLKEQFLQVQNNFTGEISSMPDPSMESDHGAWASYAKELMVKGDSLALVAGMRKTQIKRLQEDGITTLTSLAQTDIKSVKGISPETFEKIKAQADIQLRSKGQDKPLFNVLKQDNGKGLTVLPPTSDKDVFFDIEGHPLVEGGLEYLWGVSYHDKQAAQGKDYAFKDWWGNDQTQERRAFEDFIDWTYKRWQQDPAMHVYHYASYEITAIRKLSTRNQTRLEEVAELLKAGVFIDLYKVVKNGLLIGEPKYSIKNVEHLYRGKRTTDVANGGESIVFYDNWREQGGLEQWINDSNGYNSWLADPDAFDWSAWKELDDIRSYNIDDCESTLELVDWLRERQEESGVLYQPAEVIESGSEQTDKQIENKEKREALIARQQALIERFESDEKLKGDKQAAILISLLHFYDRERKPQIWSYFDRLEKNDDELFDDDTVVFNVTSLETAYEEEKLLCVGTYNKDQSVRTDKITSAVIEGSDVRANKITFSDVNEHIGQINFVIKAEDEQALQQSTLTLFGEAANINTSTLENRLCEITEQYFDTGVLSGVIKTILNQASPKFSTALSPLPVSRTGYPDDDDYKKAILKVIKGMDNTCLCIQGPPGAGKTFTAKNVIADLVKEGKRVGIMSNSHAAIMNLLLELPAMLPEARLVKVGGFGAIKDYKALYPEETYPNLNYRSSMSFTKKSPYTEQEAIGATVYSFAKELAYDDPVDYLFVDEASQVALANLIAVTGAAKNIVLMGDQMQLEQPIQGSHPEPADKSALEFMLKGHSVISEDQGVFLERTYRMHPDVCKPLSEIVYEGRLTSDKQTESQSINIDNPKYITQSTGILSVPVKHQFNTQSSEEEVKKVQQLIDELKTGSFTNNKGENRVITDDDILIVAPYNMQVNLLKEKLTGELKIGTIDKFQGQEAPVVIISMAVSDVAESSRGLDFIFDINRLNVAVSRAQALAIIVANDGLEQCHVSSLGQMEKVGFFISLSRGQ
ncbi:MAG: TM0106 family RecB-like putative nuclease [Cycloclasticus sp.]|nr:TM0106 family RecB-like putative nuclease [Cycloclasticus sp.]